MEWKDKQNALESHLEWLKLEIVAALMHFSVTTSFCSLLLFVVPKRHVGSACTFARI